MPSLADIGAHPNAVEHEVHLAPKMLHGTFKKCLKIFLAGRVGWNDRSVPTKFGKVVDFPHAHGHGGVGQDNLCALGVGLKGHLPRNGHVVQGTENNALFSFQKIVRHGSRFVLV